MPSLRGELSPSIHHPPVTSVRTCRSAPSTLPSIRPAVIALSTSTLVLVKQSHPRGSGHGGAFLGSLGRIQYRCIPGSPLSTLNHKLLSMIDNSSCRVISSFRIEALQCCKSCNYQPFPYNSQNVRYWDSLLVACCMCLCQELPITCQTKQRVDT
ncbi:hypothetical protein BXZ70DRAFT_33773 [Cristinia sonorae]|uniref:Uncharacterized protein n=1 Tax=Cristinia sonorae TaxID=1940300 RepID=A0A8K0UYX7_9AGAR|nr:hypothetical protein BXZ70DRAFT_33773 [Cristinia sonorae]